MMKKIAALADLLRLWHKNVVYIYVHLNGDLHSVLGKEYLTFLKTI